MISYEKRSLLVKFKGIDRYAAASVDLKIILGFTTQEIARSLNKQEGAVRDLQMRRLKRLAQYPAILRERAFDA